MKSLVMYNQKINMVIHYQKEDALLNHNLNENLTDRMSVQNIMLESEAVQKEIRSCHRQIHQIVSMVNESGYDGRNSETAAVVAAFLLEKLSECQDPMSEKYEKLSSVCVDNPILEIAYNHNIDKVWSSLRSLLKYFTQDIFHLIANPANLKDDNSTPKGIISLASEILDIHTEEKVADYCCGYGTFAHHIHEVNPDVNVTGYEVNHNIASVVNAFEKIYDNKFHVENVDVFSLVSGSETSPEFDKIFSNYPFGQNLRNLGCGKEYFEKLTERVPSLSKATSSDWLYNMLIMDTLKPGGKAVGIMTNGSTLNKMHAPIRKYFVENGWIECVISLPDRLFPSTSIQTSMIVFSHGNQSVRLVNATEQYQPGRRVNELAESDIKAILESCAEDGDNSISISVEELRKNEYILHPDRYLHTDNDIQNGAAFETVIKRITRGAPLNAKVLDEISSAAPTNMQYLMIANIQNGLISSDLPYLSEISKKYEKYCLSNHCLIISKNGYPYKIAVAEVPEGKRILANGNLYLIELDEEKVNPYYLAAYFASEQGNAALKRISVGGVTSNIGVDQLKKVTIPLPNMNRQKEIADQYQDAINQIAVLQSNLEKLKDQMKHIWRQE